jgi:hypothetical protein
VAANAPSVMSATSSIGRKGTAMDRRRCANCGACLYWRGIFCVDCVRMIVATVVAELAVAAIVAAVRWIF